ncbi:hypothetical protein PM082_024330 [Marasmius tenuissimus]|nr:hypothetical protein PM082_024330 [Marasmius tenuissimus]
MSPPTSHVLSRMLLNTSIGDRSTLTKTFGSAPSLLATNSLDRKPNVEALPSLTRPQIAWGIIWRMVSLVARSLGVA